MRQFQRLLILIFVAATAISPWLLYVRNPLAGQTANVALGLICVAILILIIDLVAIKTISTTLGQAVNQNTTDSSFSLQRVSYLLFVYASVVGAVLGLLAVLNSRL